MIDDRPSTPPDSWENALDLYKGLVEVSRLINGITESARLLPAILDTAKRVVHAEASSLFLENAQTGLLELRVARGPDGEVVEAHTAIPKDRGIADWVYRHGQSQIVDDAYADPRFYREVDRESGFRTRAILCVPLRHGGRATGVLQALNPVGRKSFSALQLEVMEAYAELAATAIEKLGHLERRRSQDRLQRDLELASEIQRSFLPGPLTSHGRLAAASLYRPARNIGGDFFDFHLVGDNEVFFTLGDVSGKGMPAALVMAQALSGFRLGVESGATIPALLARWNRRIHAHNLRRMFITAVVGRVRTDRMEVEIARAGHPPPLATRSDGTAWILDCPGTPPLGVLGEIHPECSTFPMQPGDSLTLYSDGLPDSFNQDNRPLEEARILRAAGEGAAVGPKAIVERLGILEAAHRGSREASDDLAILSIGSMPS